ncbi:MAG: pentapeptide repeat-containing protein [Clostridium sp.]|nr:pentapeptide repeat-containing protein [Clostridium sp.]
MENNQYKGFAYTNSSNKPTIVYGTSTEDILTKLGAYNIARTENDKFRTCNIGELNADAGKYGEYHKYDVTTGKDISSVYLQIPRLNKAEFQKVVADLKAAGARYNPNKKAWYITADQDWMEFNRICHQFSEKLTIDPVEVERPDDENRPEFVIEGFEVQYAVKVQNRTVIIPESADLNLIKAAVPVDDFLDRLNEKAVEQLRQLSDNPERIAGESEYSISVSREAEDNRCMVWFNDGREPLSMSGDEYGIHFPSMGQAEVADFVAGYMRQQEHPELNVQTEYHAGDRIDCYVPLRLQDNAAIADQPLYVENVRHVSGIVQEVRIQRDSSKEYIVLDDHGNEQSVFSDEIYAPDQARVLLRAASDELTGVQFDLLADKRLTAAQMEEIRFGYKDGLRVEQVALYSNPEMSTAEMDLCRIALTNGLGYAEISGLLKETKELSWTDSRNRLNEVIKEHRAVKEAQHAVEPPVEEQEASQKEAADTTETAADLRQEDMVSQEGEKLTEVQSHIVEHINENFFKGSVSIEAVGNDRIRITDRTGESMNFAMDQNGGIIDADTGKLYGYAKDGYRPPEKAETGDFYGIEVPLEDGMRVIPQDVIDKLIAGTEFPELPDHLDLTNCIFRNITFTRFGYHSSTFANADFSNSRFYGCKFDNMDFRGSNFQGAGFVDTDFDGAILNQCNFHKATIADSRFLEADVVEVDFSEASLKRSAFKGCAMERNNFLVTRMDAVDVDAECGITANQQHLDTITYTVGGATHEEAEKARDKVMWRLSGSEVSYERKEELSHLLENESNNPDTQEWREDLTYEERELVDSWTQQYPKAMTGMRQQTGREQANTQSVLNKRSVVDLLHEKKNLVSAQASAAAPSHDDRIRKAEAIAK